MPDGERAYGFAMCYFLSKKNPELSKQNADCYSQFALAMYFDKIDFATGRAKAIGASSVEIQNFQEDEPLVAGDAESLLDVGTSGLKRVTDPGNLDPDVFEHADQISIANSMIDAMTKSEIEKPPKMRTVPTGRPKRVHDQVVLQDL